MTPRVVVVPLVVVLLSWFPPRAAADDTFAECRTRPANIYVNDELDPVMEELLARSQTFRRQCGAIAAARARIRIVVRLDARGSTTRARAAIGRTANGFLWARIDVPPVADYAELLPHEFEHVLEQIEGVDLAAQARTGRGALALLDGSFETTRARDAGLAAAREYYGEITPPFESAVRGVQRAIRALGSRADRGPALRIRAGAHKDF